MPEEGRNGRLVETYFRKNPAACRQCLLQLVGKTLSMVSHAGGMRAFHFGRLEETPRGRRGELVIHVQCSWRLVNGSRILTGLGDWGQFADESQQNLAEWDPAKHGNRQQSVLEEWMRVSPGAMAPIYSCRQDLVVDATTIDVFGDADVVLVSGDTLQIFPDCSLEENWRIFYPDGSHFVV